MIYGRSLRDTYIPIYHLSCMGMASRYSWPSRSCQADALALHDGIENRKDSSDGHFGLQSDLTEELVLRHYSQFLAPPLCNLIAQLDISGYSAISSGRVGQHGPFASYNMA